MPFSIPNLSLSEMLRIKVKVAVQRIDAPIPHIIPANKKRGYFLKIIKKKAKRKYEKLPAIILFLIPI